MAIININQLRKADVIVSTTDAAVSGAIRGGIGADFSHSMLYKGNNRVIEAISEGVVERTWDAASAESTLAIALRRRNMTDVLKNEVIRYGESFLNLPYDGIGAVGAGISKPRGRVLWGGVIIGSPVLGGIIDAGTQLAILNNARAANRDTAFFCSELVARCFQLAGIPLSDGVQPTYTNPREIRMSAHLMYLGHLIS